MRWINWLIISQFHITLFHLFFFYLSYTHFISFFFYISLTFRKCTPLRGTVNFTQVHFLQLTVFISNPILSITIVLCDVSWKKISVYLPHFCPSKFLHWTQHINEVTALMAHHITALQCLTPAPVHPGWWREWYPGPIDWHSNAPPLE